MAFSRPALLLMHGLEKSFASRVPCFYVAISIYISFYLEVMEHPQVPGIKYSKLNDIDEA